MATTIIRRGRKTVIIHRQRRRPKFHAHIPIDRVVYYRFRYINGAYRCPFCGRR